MNSPKNLVKKTEAEIIQFWGGHFVGLVTTILTLFTLTAEACIYTLKHRSSFKVTALSDWIFWLEKPLWLKQVKIKTFVWQTKVVYVSRTLRWEVSCESPRTCIVFSRTFISHWSTGSNNSSIWSRMWKRKACGPQREHWLLRRRQSKSADLFHAAVPINISELHTQWRFTEYLFPFFLCSHTPLGTWLNNDYGIDAWICLQISMAGIMKEGGSVRSYINAMWTFCWNQSLKWSFSGTGILTRSSGLYGFIFLTFYMWEKK